MTQFRPCGLGISSTDWFWSGYASGWGTGILHVFLGGFY